MDFFVSDIQAAIGSDGDSQGIAQLGLGRRPTITREAVTARTCHRGDHATDPDSPNAVVTKVGDVQAAIGPNSDSQRIAQLRFGCHPSITREAAKAPAR